MIIIIVVLLLYFDDVSPFCRFTRVQYGDGACNKRGATSRLMDASRDYNNMILLPADRRRPVARFTLTSRRRPREYPSNGVTS